MVSASSSWSLHQTRSDPDGDVISEVGEGVLVYVGALDGLLGLLESWTNVLVPREGLLVGFSQ